MDKKERWQQYYAVHRDRLLAQQRERRAKNRDKANAKQREYYAKSCGQRREYNRKYKIANQEKLVALRRSKKYGLSASGYRRLWDQQNGLCAICGLPGDKLCVDHDHTTGQIRGLVHGACNSGIGLLGDSAETAEKAATYLRKTQPHPFAAEKYREDYGF